VPKEDLAAAMKDALAAVGLTEKEFEQEQHQHQNLSQQSRMRQGLFGGFRKHEKQQQQQPAAAAEAGVATAAVSPAAAAATAAGTAKDEKAAVTPADPLAITHKAELNITSGGELVGKVVLGLFGNIAPKTVQNVSGQSGDQGGWNR
jgi:biotin carboxyl carrier protein